MAGLFGRDKPKGLTETQLNEMQELITNTLDKLGANENKKFNPTLEQLQNSGFANMEEYEDYKYRQGILLQTGFNTWEEWEKEVKVLREGLEEEEKREKEEEQEKWEEWEEWQKAQEKKDQEEWKEWEKAQQPLELNTTKESAEPVVNGYPKTREVKPKKEGIASFFQTSRKKGEKKESDNIEGFKTLIKDSVLSHLNAKTAPWLKPHDGNVEKSFFPTNNYAPSGITAVWLKLQEQQLGTDDPRWYSRSDIFKSNHQICIKPKESGTVISFKEGDTVRYNYYFNASQLRGVEPYIPQYEKSAQNPKLYHPQKTRNTFHLKKILRVDIANWFSSLETHTPYKAQGLNRVQEVSNFLKNSKSDTFFFIAKDASDTSMKINKKKCRYSKKIRVLNSANGNNTILT